MRPPDPWALPRPNVPTVVVDGFRAFDGATRPLGRDTGTGGLGLSSGACQHQGANSRLALLVLILVCVDPLMEWNPIRVIRGGTGA
jgi:hypothetical protein